MRPPLTQQSHRRRILQDLSGFGYSPKQQRDEQTGPCFAVNLEVIPASIMSEEDAMDHPQPTKSFSRHGGQVMIGRASRSSGELPTAENGWYRNAVMSRRHAILRWGESGISIKDRDSTHGTRVYRNGQILSAREQPVLLQDGDEIQFGKTVHRVEGKSDATTACHNPLRVRVTITQPSEQPKVTIKPEPVSPEKPGKFMSHTFSFSAGGESEDDERSVLKKALELNQSTAIVKAPISDSTASTADKSDMSISENDEDDAANQFTFSSPPLPSQTPRTDLHSTTGGKTLPSAERAKRRYTASPEGSEDEQGGEVTRRKGNATLADIREHAKRRYTSSPENSENENEEDEEEEVEHDDEAEEDPFSSSRPSSPDTTMKPDDTASLVEAEQGSEHSSFGTQKTSEEEEKDSSMSEDVKMTAEDGQTAFSNEAGQDAKAAVRKSTEAQITENKSAVDVLAARSSTPDSAKLAPVRAATHCETSQQTLAGRTIHLFEPQFLPTISPTLATNNVATSVLVPDSQEVSSSLSSNKITQTTLYGFFKPTNTVLTASSDAATTASQSDEEGQSDTSERTTSPSPEQHKSGTSSAPVQVIGKRKRDEEIQEVPVEVTQPFKPIKKARRGLSLRSAVSHTVSLAAGAVMAVALLSVMPDLEA